MTGALEHFRNFSFVSVGHRSDDRFLILKIAIDQADTDASLGADVVHARLMKSVFGEANERSLEDLRSAIESGRFSDGVRH